MSTSIWLELHTRADFFHPMSVLAAHWWCNIQDFPPNVCCMHYIWTSGMSVNMATRERRKKMLSLSVMGYILRRRYQLRPKPKCEVWAHEWLLEREKHGAHHVLSFSTHHSHMCTSPSVLHLWSHDAVSHVMTGRDILIGWRVSSQHYDIWQVGPKLTGTQLWSD